MSKKDKKEKQQEEEKQQEAAVAAEGQQQESANQGNGTEEQFDVPEAEEVEQMEADEIVELLEGKEKKIEELEQQLEELKDSNLRKAAELQNVQKRFKRDRNQVYEQARISALEDFLPINDDLQRTLKASEGLEIDDKFLDGVKMVAQKFEEVLNKLGVERIDQTMVPFDVDLHDAMMKQPAPSDDVGSNMVLQVIENGYKIGEKTIRHAKVIVSE